MRDTLLAQFDLTDRHAVVSGGNSGIGEAMALALGLAGARLTLIARRQDRLDRARSRFEGLGITCDTVAADLAEAAPTRRAGERIAEAGGADILVNAAGINLREPFEQVSAEAFDRHMAVHLRAPFLLTQVLAPGMRDRGYGRIINLASLQSSRAFADSAPYGAAKGGIVQLTRAIAQAWSAYGITCNAIGPGFFPTELTAPVFADAERAQALARQTAIGRNGRLDDLHGITVFLASPASAYVTGQTIMVDGGFTAK
ncbi:MAG: SDR family oxidoreductase [Burkholderiaceae bacterium]